jgi:2-polyprenyl-3-methyl-5-hydroxy-6-metoxy-1,4-benzoquinol methylase
MHNPETSIFFDTYADKFNDIYGNNNNLVNRFINRHFRQSMLERFFAVIKGCYPIEGKSAIDIGCGPGLYSVELASKGAAHILGLDFAEGMIRIAEKRAEEQGVSGVCEFVHGDFIDYSPVESFDYAIVMGLMDYIEDAASFVTKVLSITNDKAFFSFPSSSGFLAWQRKLRYKRRCNLFLYDEPSIRRLFEGRDNIEASIEKMHRDFFVTAQISAST